MCASCRRSLAPPGPVSPPPGIDELWVAWGYRGVARDLVAGVKYRNERGPVAPLGAVLASLVPDPRRWQVVTWVPASPERRRARGFDHGALLARAVARSLRLPCRRTLVRRAGSHSQTGHTRAERLAGPSLAAATRAVPGAVLVVDDVVTTGSSLAAAAAALRRGGGLEIGAVVAAATPELRRSTA